MASPDLARLLSACALMPPAGGPERSATPETLPRSNTSALLTQQKPPMEDHAVRRGCEWLKFGDITGARTTFAYAVQVSGGSRVALLGLARTYNPEVLKSLKMFGDLADAGKAQEPSAQAQNAPGGAPRRRGGLLLP